MANRAFAGIDWATEAKNRAAVVIEVDGSRFIVTEVRSPLSEREAAELCLTDRLETVGVDIPFGWPTEFTNFVAAWGPESGTGVRIPTSDAFRFRVTDRVVRDELRKTPLAVSADRIALGAHAWARLAAANGLSGRFDVGSAAPRRPSPTIIEVYPGATLASFVGNFPQWVISDYKKEEGVRFALIARVVEDLNLVASDAHIHAIVGKANDSDKFDALIAALTAAAYGGCLTGYGMRLPRPDEIGSARQEGWIFFPVRE